MSNTFKALVFIPFLIGSVTALAQDRGETIYNQTCVACHTIGGGRLIGPDLANVHSRRDESWLLSFIKTPGAFASKNDEAATLLTGFNGLVMPDQALTDDDIRAVIGFIARSSPANSEVSTEPVAEVRPEDLAADRIQLGEDLFVGRTRFENGATACSACHTVNTSAVMTGGSLAKNLTDAVPRLSRTGVDAMMASPPFPAMRMAFLNKSLTDAERGAIVDFLQASAEASAQASAEVSAEVAATGAGGGTVDYAFRLGTYGAIGLVLLLGLFSLLGLRGAQKSVNQAVYDRQIKST